MADILRVSPPLETITSSPEGLLNLLVTIDGWKITPSPRFERAVQINKTRKGDTPISIHLSQDGRFLKLAEFPTWNSLITKEFDCWQAALDNFEVTGKVQLGKIQVPKPGDKPRFYTLKYLDMPYMGIPIKYLDLILPGIVNPEAKQRLLSGLDRLAIEKGICHEDLNTGNILGRAEDGKVQLFPIDYESADINLKGQRLEKLRNRQFTICQKVLASIA